MGRAVLAALVLVALVAWTVDRALVREDAREAAASRVDAVALAERQVLALTSVGPGEGGSLDELVSDATPEFRDQLRSSAEAISEALRQEGVQGVGRIASAGISDQGDDRASVLVVAVGVVQRDEKAQPEQRVHRVEVDLERDDDRWLVAGLELW